MKKIARYNRELNKVEWFDADRVPPYRHPEGAPSAINKLHKGESRALACHRTQVAEFNGYLQERGETSAHYRDDGTFVYETRQARNRELMSRGFADNDAGYGDFSGNHS